MGGLVDGGRGVGGWGGGGGGVSGGDVSEFNFQIVSCHAFFFFNLIFNLFIYLFVTTRTCHILMLNNYTSVMFGACYATNV